LSHDFKHRGACFESKKGGKKTTVVVSCRYRYPRHLVPFSHINLEEMCVEMQRLPGSAWLNPHSPTIFRAFKCNNDVRFLIGSEPGTLYYTACYPAKDQQKKQLLNSVLNSAFSCRLQYEQQQQQWQEKSEPSIGRGRVLSSLYHLTSSDATGLPLAAYYLQNGCEAFHFSHSFTSVSMPQLQNFLMSVSEKLSVPITQRGEHLGWTVQLIYDYIHCPNKLGTWPYFLYVAFYEKRKKKGMDEDEARLASRDNDFVSSLLLSLHYGRDNHVLLNQVLSFRETHPQSATHELALRTETQIPQLNGRRLFSSQLMCEDGEASEDRSEQGKKLTLSQQHGYFVLIGPLCAFSKSE